jgi:hypothetical protein
VASIRRGFEEVRVIPYNIVDIAAINNYHTHINYKQRDKVMEKIYTKSEVIVTTKSGVELMLFVVFVPYLDRYIVDSEVNVRRKDGSWHKRCVETSVSMTGSRCYERAIELAECYLDGYAEHFEDY